MVENEPLLLVDVETELATCTDVEIGMSVAAYVNTLVPLSVVVYEEDRLSIRFRVRITREGRSLLPVLRTAVLLQADYAAAARQLFSEDVFAVVRPSSDGVPVLDGVGHAPHSAFRAAVPGSGGWFEKRWLSLRTPLNDVMKSLGWPTGWGNSEVQHFNELPPDVAVALLDPPDPMFSPMGTGVSVIARVAPPTPPGVDPVRPELLNEFNLYMLQTGYSVFGPLRSDNANLIGARVQIWVPVEGFLKEDFSDGVLAVCLGNLAQHTTRAPFVLI